MKKYISPLILLGAAIIWGFAFSAQKAAEATPPFALGAARSAVATLFLLLLVPISSKLTHTGATLSKKRTTLFTKDELIGGAICGGVLAVASFFQQAGMAAGTEASKASFITALYVILVPIYALALRKRAPLNVWISVPIAVIGFYLLCIEGDFSVTPEDMTVFACALIFPIHILTIDFYSPRCDGIRMSCIQFAVCGAVSLVMSLFTETASMAQIVECALPILFLGVVSSGVAYTLQIIGQRGTNPTAATLILSLESVFGVVGAAIFLGEVMTPKEYIGAGVVFLAVLLSQFDVFAFFGRKSKV